MSTVWEDVKGRKIFKAATLYAAVTWGIIQIADILLPVLRYPEWVMSSMVLIAFSGFPIALMFGWMLDMKNERKRSLAGTGQDGKVASLRDRLIEFSIIVVFGGSAGFLYLNSANQPAEANIEPLPTVQELTRSTTNQKTIAVLPFVSFGSSENDDYFADGLSEELLNVLARNKNLRVAARTSSFQYKNKNINIKTIARELGVQYILEGSVRRSGDLIRVTAQLIKADEDVHIFSSSWDKNITNIFKVQDEIAGSVLETLEVKLFGKNVIEPSNIGTEDIVAFAEYSRGVALVRNRSKEDFDQAIVHFEKALELDNRYAVAYAMLAETYLLKLSYGLMKAEDAFELAKPNIERALEIDKEQAEGHAVMGLMKWQMSGSYESKDDQIAELQKAKFHLNKAIAINPSNAEAYMWFGSILQNEGNAVDGFELHRKAFEIDPQAAVVGYNWAGDLVKRGRYEEAMEVFNTVVRNNPNYANAYDIAGSVSMAVGQLDQAYKLYQRISELSQEEEQWLMKENQILLPFGLFDRAQANLDKMKLSTNEKVIKYLPELQAELWIASHDFVSLKKWTDTLDEDSQHWGDRLWRGVSELTQQNWKYAIEDLEVASALLQKDNHHDKRKQIQVELFLATAHKALGNKLESESYLDSILSNLQSMLQSELVSPHLLRYSQAAHAALANDKLTSLSLLRQAIQEGFVDVWLLKVDPAFNDFRDDPTYLAILREVDSKLRLMRLNIPELDQQLAVRN
ncbi:MAG: hypothetical protein KUG78_11135 [Kangiellaceae bacterium]|nr:hypothetical protein [Kangiellaceae bacterium]